MSIQLILRLLFKMSMTYLQSKAHAVEDWWGSPRRAKSLDLFSVYLLVPLVLLVLLTAALRQHACTTKVEDTRGVNAPMTIPLTLHQSMHRALTNGFVTDNKPFQALSDQTDIVE